MNAPKAFAREYFLILLPLFFALRGYCENFAAMTPGETFLLFGQYVLAGLAMAALFFLFFRSFRKAALLAFCLLAFHLFFGAAHDALKRIFPSAFLNQYAFVLPAAFIALMALFIFFKQSKRRFQRLVLYLNFLFLLFIVLEIPALMKAASTPQRFNALAGTKPCDTCDKPDVYFIIADEYADSTSLQQIFNFNNGSFQAALRSRGFHVVNNSRSNYNFTPFCMASILQMDYLTGIEGRNQSLADKNRCYDAVNRSGLWAFLKDNGYEIKNHSVFNIANMPTPAPHNYILIGKDMVESQTFLSRINRDLRFHLADKFGWTSERNRVLYFEKRCNDLLLQGLLNETKKQTVLPRFIYAHITMPHYPYYFKKDGTPNPPELLTEGNQNRKPEYIGYLQYSNGVFLQAIDAILKGSKRPPIIVFMGDHGFREFDGNLEKWAPYYYMNLNAVLLPSKDYAAFYDGISGVNQFRVLLNSVFAQKLAMLKDSTILLRE